VLTRLKGSTDHIHATALSPDGKLVLTGSGANSEVDIGFGGTLVQLWDASSGSEIKRLAGHKHTPLVLLFSPDGNRILTVDQNEDLRLWDAGSGRLVSEFEGAEWPGAEFSRGGRTFVAFGSGGIHVLDAETGRQLLQIEDNRAAEFFFSSARFSPDGHRIVTTALARDDARIWDVAMGRQVGSLAGHKGYVIDAVFLPDGKRILTGSKDGTVRLWDAETGHELRKFVAPGPVHRILLSPDGKRCIAEWEYAHGTQVAVEGEEHSSLLDVEAEREVVRFNAKTTEGLVGFSPGSSTLLALGDYSLQHAFLFSAATGKQLRQVNLDR